MKLTPTGLACGLVAALACGCATGYWFGRLDSDDVFTARLAEKSATSNPESNRGPNHSTEVAADTNNAEVANNSASTATNTNIPDQFAELLKIDSWTTRGYKLEQLFESMTLDEAPEILDSILAVANARDRSRLIGPFFKRWGQLDGYGAVAQAEELVGRDGRSALGAAMNGWAENDPFEAWEVAKEWVPGASPYTTTLFSGALTELAKRDLGAGLATYQIADNRWSRNRVQSALTQAAFDTDQVPMLISYVRGMENSQDKEQWITSVFRQWGATDTGEPLDAMSQIANHDVAKKAMEGFLQGWMQSDPDGAIDYAIANHQESLVSDSIGPLVGTAFFSKTPDEQLDLAARIAEAGLLEKAAPRMISSLATNNPELALHMASLVSDADDRETYTQNAIANWSYNDFDEAAAYINQMPQSSLKTKTIGALTWSAMRNDRGMDQIVAWMKEVPTGTDRTKVVEQMLSAAASPYAEPEPEFLAAIRDIAAGETDLSEDAIKHRDKLFGAPATTTRP